MSLSIYKIIILLLCNAKFQVKIVILNWIQGKYNIYSYKFGFYFLSRRLSWRFGLCLNSVTWFPPTLSKIFCIWDYFIYFYFVGKERLKLCTCSPILSIFLFLTSTSWHWFIDCNLKYSFLYFIMWFSWKNHLLQGI